MNSTTSLAFDKAEVQRALDIFVDPAALVMVQSLPSRRYYTFHGSQRDMILATIEHFAGENPTGIYVSLNPVRMGVERCVQNEDIVKRHVLYVDIDRDKTQCPEESVTDGEKWQVRELADQVIAFLKVRGLPAPIVVDSGNGVHLLWRIDMPNEEASKVLIKEFLATLQARFGKQIDTSVCDARRIIRIPGTVNAKGTATPERPHRLAKILDMPADALSTIVAPQMLQRIIDIAKVTSTLAQGSTPTEPPVPIIVQAPGSTSASAVPLNPADAVATKSGSSGDRPGDDFNDRGSWDEILCPHGWQQFKVTSERTEWTRPGKDDGCSATTGFCQGDESGDLLYVFSSNAAPFEANRGYSKFAAYALLFHQGNFSEAAAALAAKGYGKRAVNGNDAGLTDAAVKEDVDDPYRLARLYLKQKCTTANGELALRYWRQDWMRWHGSHYRAIPDEEVRAEVLGVVKAEFDRANLELRRRWKQGGEPPPAPIKVTTNLIANVLASLQSMTILPAAVHPPLWLDGNSAQNVILLTCNNGLLDVMALFRQQGQPMRPHSPNWFATARLPYAFDPAADCPKWRAFIDRNLEGDQERIAILQEWFGYCLVRVTNFQKFLALTGDGANGKSVICGALAALLGVENCSFVPLELFHDKFQLGHTLGKLANIASECGDIDKVAEGILKSFTAGDLMHFDRKYRKPIEALPTARFTLATNNRPRFSDRTGGLWRRMILMPLHVVIAESERILGMDKPGYWHIHGELPGMLNWALAGLDRLRRQGRFTKSSVCDAAVAEYRIDCNPAMEFLLDTCKEDPQSRIPVATLYKRYAEWCKANGYQPLGDNKFGGEVRRAFPKVKKHRLVHLGCAVYEGIAPR